MMNLTAFSGSRTSPVNPGYGLFLLLDDGGGAVCIVEQHPPVHGLVVPPVACLFSGPTRVAAALASGMRAYGLTRLPSGPTPVRNVFGLATLEPVRERSQLEKGVARTEGVVLRRRRGIRRRDVGGSMMLL